VVLEVLLQAAIRASPATRIKYWLFIGRFLNITQMGDDILCQSNRWAAKPVNFTTFAQNSEHAESHPTS
jgi:hypothetical protein